MKLTEAQQRAIAARGRLLVVAGAGTGKTSTLVERCLRCLLQDTPPVSLEEILIVTFTDAAAAEMRQRIRARLEEEAGSSPEKTRWQEQLALFDTACIGTLHSFCLRLVREHFYELELDPQLSVMADEEARMLAEETLTAVLQRHYSGQSTESPAVQELIQVQSGGWDWAVRKLILKVHHYTQTLPDPEAWFGAQSKIFETPEPAHWAEWLLEGLADWRERWVDFVAEFPSENQVAVACSEALARLPARPARSEAAVALAEISEAARTCPFGKKESWVEPLKRFLAESEFLLAVCRIDGEKDPLSEDWGWMRGHMATLLMLAQEFQKAFTETKRELAVVDFHDLEQYTLRLLWDRQTQSPTAIARAWRQRLRYVFVDEYQDINAAQDKIIAALSREGSEANRFLVGDVKQSIYRFRLANPHIFQSYVSAWGQQGQAVALVENFRSREAILNFVNSLFSGLMREKIGGVAYDETARLQFGKPEQRRELTAAADPRPAVELHLRVKKRASEEDEQEAETLAEIEALDEADKDARLLAMRLSELKTQRFPVWDDREGCFRPVEWKDMAVLLRARAGKAESYAKEFARLNIPMLVERGGFYRTLEILDLLSLLQVLDNPLQDVPLLAVLHSPLVGLTLEELGSIRLVQKGSFWTALLKWNEGGVQSSPETSRKVQSFLERFGRWRRLARQASLSRCLDIILAETHYTAWLLTQDRGGQRQANVQRLLGLAQRFDRFQRQGLFRFLGFIAAQQELEKDPDIAAVHEENAVRLMSIHQSKGLEFPIVAISDLGKFFNTRELRAELTVDETYGLCPQIKPPQSGRRYPSLSHWLASRRQERELWGEEMRLLYVAATRAKDRLILNGGMSASRFEKFWCQLRTIRIANLFAANSYLDWLGLWFGQSGERLAQGRAGQDQYIAWEIHEARELLKPVEPQEASPGLESGRTPPVPWEKLEQRLSWQYPAVAATRVPAKTTVTALRRRAVGESIADAAEENSSAAWNLVNDFNANRTGSLQEADERGNAHHTFLQFVSLDRVGSTEELQAEAQRLLRANTLTEGAVEALDFAGLAAFWGSELGQRIRSQARWLRRELVFTARFSPVELAQITGETMEADLADEFVIVQGVVDLAVIAPEEIWLVDFKTDRAPNLAEKAKIYAPQLKLYGQALSRIYQRPVTASWLYFISARQAVEATV